MSDQAKLILERAKKRKAAFGVSSPGPQVSQPYRVQFFYIYNGIDSIHETKQPKCAQVTVSSTDR